MRGGLLHLMPCLHDHTARQHAFTYTALGLEIRMSETQQVEDGNNFYPKGFGFRV